MTTRNVTLVPNTKVLVGSGLMDFTIQPVRYDVMYFIASNQVEVDSLIYGIRLIGGQNQSIRVPAGESLFVSGEDNDTLIVIETVVS